MPDPSAPGSEETPAKPAGNTGEVKPADRTNKTKTNGRNDKLRRVGPVAVVVISACFAVSALALMYGIYRLWPRKPTPPAKPATTQTKTAPDSLAESLPGAEAASQVTTGPDSTGKDTTGQGESEQEIPPTPDFDLLLLAALVGALGSIVHATRSFYNYTGERKLLWSWIPSYFLMPFNGSALAVIFYIIVRGGFLVIAPSTGRKLDVSLWSVCALSGLVGLFTEEALSKLKKIARAVFDPPEPSSNTLKDPIEEDSDKSETSKPQTTDQVRDANAFDAPTTDTAQPGAEKTEPKE